MERGSRLVRFRGLENKTIFARFGVWDSERQLGGLFRERFAMQLYTFHKRRRYCWPEFDKASPENSKTGLETIEGIQWFRS